MYQWSSYAYGVTKKYDDGQCKPFTCFIISIQKTIMTNESLAEDLVMKTQHTIHTYMYILLIHIILFKALMQLSLFTTGVDKSTI